MADLNPDYTIGSLLPELLQSDLTEAQLLGLRTLQLVAMSVPADSGAAVEARAAASRRSVAAVAASGSGGSSSSKRMVQVRAGPG